MFFWVKKISLFFVFISVSVFSQDTLAKYSYLELDDLIHSSISDSIETKIYLNYYKNKAIKERNNYEIALYYKNYVFLNKNDHRIKIIDSALHYAYKTNDKKLIGQTYSTKGVVYYNLKDYQKALENYLKAYSYIQQTDHLYSNFRLKYQIAVIKNYLGYYQEAEALFKECINYFAQEPTKYNMQRGYISSLEGLAWSLTKTNRLTESNKILKDAFKFIQLTKAPELDAHYNIFKQGINDYFLGNYDQAIQKIEEKLPYLYQNEDVAWVTIGKFYLGKCYWVKNQKDKSLEYLKKVHDVFDTQNYTHPDVRESYELLIEYYKSIDDKDNQIKYIEQLVKVDSVYNQNHKYLVKQIHKEYETQELLTKKRELEASLYVQKNRIILVSSIAGFILTISLIFHAIQRKKSKQIALKLIHQNEKIQETKDKEITQDKNSIKTQQLIKDDTTQKLLRKLQDFENKQKFRKPDISLEKLAKELETNTTYLSTIVNTYKSQKFNDYINGLRISYFIDEMVNNPDCEYYRFSLEAISKDLGFISSTAFSKAFNKHTQTSPSVFIKNLREKNHLHKL